MKANNSLAFPVLTDLGNAYAHGLQLAFELPEDVRAIYSNFGIALPDLHGEDSWTLPLPTRIVVDRQGVIARIDADPDYTVRPEAETSLEALAALGS